MVRRKSPALEILLITGGDDRGPGVHPRDRKKLVLKRHAAEMSLPVGFQRLLYRRPSHPGERQIRLEVLVHWARIDLIGVGGHVPTSRYRDRGQDSINLTLDTPVKELERDVVVLPTRYSGVDQDVRVEKNAHGWKRENSKRSSYRCFS